MNTINLNNIRNKIYNRRAKYQLILKGLANKNMMQDINYKQNNFESLMPNFLSFKKYIMPNKYNEEPNNYTFKSEFIKQLRPRFQIRVKRFYREMENHKFAYRQLSKITEVKNQYMANLLIHYKDTISRNLIPVILNNIYKNGMMRTTYLKEEARKRQQEVTIKSYYEDVKMHNFIKYSNPYGIESDSDDEY